MSKETKNKVVDFAEFKHEMDRMFMNPTEQTIDDLIQVIKKQNEHIEFLFEMAKNTEDRVCGIHEQIFEMFPDTEIIETMGCDNQDDRMKMYKNYLNLNEDWDVTETN